MTSRAQSIRRLRSLLSALLVLVFVLSSPALAQTPEEPLTVKIGESTIRL